VIFKRVCGGSITISLYAMQMLAEHCQRDDQMPEAGGVLLGRLIRDTEDYIVDQITVPGVGDKASRHGFRRAKKRTQELIDQAWFESNGTKIYLGEWHTHPEDTPIPSTVDVVNWLRLAESAKYEQNSLLFLIVGRKELRMWELIRESAVLVDLKPD
jgi:integrative and conjugative element protein (TIGR02256 family)